MIQLENLTKSYGERTVVDDVTNTMAPGRVRGFVGPPGAGMATTMRMILGFDRPARGRALILGGAYAELRSPLTRVGALLDAKGVHPSRSARQHLVGLAATHHIPKSRVADVIRLAGLESVADKRVGAFSLGMGQRLGIAAALLGDPDVLLLDEPVNGLDPEGVLWVRELARGLAAEGRTVFLSSHLMSEMAQVADHIIVLGRGRVLADSPVDEILAGATGQVVRVRTPRLAELLRALPEVSVTERDEGSAELNGLGAEAIADAALAAGIPLYELTPVSASLEEAYLALTRDAVEYRTGGAR